jgi:hypothetical protein
MCFYCFGCSRYDPGFRTAWVLDLQSLRQMQGSAAHRNVTVFSAPSADANSIAPDDPLQPVRVITLFFHIDKAVFKQAGNSISVFSGNKTQGALVMLLGTDLTQCVNDSEADLLSTPQSLAQYASAVAGFSEPCVVTASILSNAAVVVFASRDVQGTHFVATYSYSFNCPGDLELVRAANETFCLPPFSPKYPGVVWTFAAFAAAFVVLQGVIMAAYWGTPIYRAASRPFLVLLLACLLAFAFGPLLYSADPTTVPGSLHICAARAWFTGLPLAGVLGVLWAKTWRVYRLFCGTKIKDGMNMSDRMIGRIAAAILGVEAVLLIIFSVLPLSLPQKASGSDSGIGNFSTFVLRQCSQEEGFWPFMALQLGLFLVLTTGALVLSWRTRHVPSAFRESLSIMLAFFFMLVAALVLVPLIGIFEGHPTVCMLLQGCGQGFVAVLLTAALFGPKMHTALTMSEEQQRALTGVETNGGAASANPYPENSATSQGFSMQRSSASKDGDGTGGGGGGGGGAKDGIPRSVRTSAIPVFRVPQGDSFSPVQRSLSASAVLPPVSGNAPRASGSQPEKARTSGTHWSESNGNRSGSGGGVTPVTLHCCAQTLVGTKEDPRVSSPQPIIDPNTAIEVVRLLSLSIDPANKHPSPTAVESRSPVATQLWEHAALPPSSPSSSQGTQPLLRDNAAAEQQENAIDIVNRLRARIAAMEIQTHRRDLRP